MAKMLELKLTWSQAKALQIAIAWGKAHTKGELLKTLEELEGQLENFTETTSAVFHVLQSLGEKK
jgi:hypothetical protein